MTVRPISPALVARAQQLLCKLQPLSEVSAAQVAPIGHGQVRGGMPAGLVFAASGQVVRVRSVLEVYGTLLDRASANGSDEQYSSAIRWGQRQYDSITHGPIEVTPETPREFRERIVREYQGVIAPVVAAKERCSVALIRQARLRQGRTARFGHVPAQ